MTTESPTRISTHAEARAALGQLVQVRGVVQHEKLGDTVNVGDLSVRCADVHPPEAATTVTVEGKVEIMSDDLITGSANGEISQGTEAPSSTFAIRNCVMR